MTHNSTLPFELSTTSLAHWLESLTALQTPRAASQLNQVMKQLKNVEVDPTIRLPLLIRLIPATLYLSQNLTTTALSDAQPSEKKSKIVKLCIHLPRNLALGLSQLAENEALDDANRQTALYHGLQVIGYCLRCYRLFEEMPSATLWRKSAFLYRLAEYKEWLTQNQSPRLPEFKQQASIEDVIKRNLLFSLMTQGQFEINHIHDVFLLANQHSHLLDISTDPWIRDFGFYWDLNGDQPPCPSKRIRKPLPEGHMAIDSRRIGNALQIGSLTTQLSPAFQNQLALPLTGYQQIFNSLIPGQPSRSELVLGFAHVCIQLKEQNKLEKILQLSAQLPNSKVSKRAMTLVPLEHERSIFQPPDQLFGNPQLLSRPVNILKTPSKIHMVAEGRAFDCETGDIALLYKEQQSASLAIVRQQSPNDMSGSTHILLEKISDRCSIYAFNSDAGTQQVVIVDENGDHPEAFLAPGKYSNGTKIVLNTGQTLHLTACLESNSFYARFKIRFDS